MLWVLFLRVSNLRIYAFEETIMEEWEGCDCGDRWTHWSTKWRVHWCSRCDRWLDPDIWKDGRPEKPMGSNDHARPKKGSDPRHRPERIAGGAGKIEECLCPACGCTHNLMIHLAEDAERPFNKLCNDCREFTEFEGAIRSLLPEYTRAFKIHEDTVEDLIDTLVSARPPRTESRRPIINILRKHRRKG